LAPIGRDTKAPLVFALPAWAARIRGAGAGQNDPANPRELTIEMPNIFAFFGTHSKPAPR
jgi:hypothetical protein